MWIASIILGVLGLFLLLGLGRNLMKDYDLHPMFAIAFLALAIGLSFLPTIRWGNFSFNVGAAVFYLGTLGYLLVRGRLRMRLSAIAIGLILGSLVYGATRLAVITGNDFFSRPNYAYALMTALVAVLVVRNGKYATLIGVLAMLLPALLVQIGSEEFYLGYTLEWSALAFGTAALLYEGLARLAVRPEKTAYFFEAGRLED